jgi:hypothetical protein
VCVHTHAQMIQTCTHAHANEKENKSLARSHGSGHLLASACRTDSYALQDQSEFFGHGN